MKKFGKIPPGSENPRVLTRGSSILFQKNLEFHHSLWLKEQKINALYLQRSSTRCQLFGTLHLRLDFFGGYNFSFYKDFSKILLNCLLTGSLNSHVNFFSGSHSAMINWSGGKLISAIFNNSSKR